jgi:hypothetical protein
MDRPVKRFVTRIVRPQARRPEESRGGLDGKAHQSTESSSGRPLAVIPLVPSRWQLSTVNHVAYPLVPALTSVRRMMLTTQTNIINFMHIILSGL